MQKLKQFLSFLLALLNFLFHFKDKTDGKEVSTMEPGPQALPPSPEARNEPVFETIP